MDNELSYAKVRLNNMRSLLHIISTEETRYYLNGVFIEPHADGGAVLTATDGHKMVSIYEPEAVVTGPARIWRIRELAATIKAVIASSKKSRNVIRADLFFLEYREVENDEKTKFTASLVNDFQEINMLLSQQAHIDGTFPQLGKVVPSTQLERTGACISAKVLRDIVNFCQEFTGHAATPISLELLDPSGPSIFRVSSAEAGEAFGVLMPMRGDRIFSAPAWLANHYGRPEIGPERYVFLEQARETEEAAKTAVFNSVKRAA